MITVFSQQRPARPRWALPVGVALLALTLIMAAGLIAVKKGSQHVSLGPAGELPGELRGALPEGWDVIPEAELPRGAVYGVVEPSGRRGATPRQVYLLRGMSEPFALPSREGDHTLQLIAKDAILRFCRAAGCKLMRFDVAAADFDSIGPFAGFTARVESIVTTGRGPSPYYHLGRMAVTPTGQIFGVLIETGNSLRRADALLLDHLCEHLAVTNESLTSEVSAAMESAGFRFRPPTEVKAVVRGESDLRPCVVTGGGQEGWWCLDIHQAPLIEDRRAGDLLTDYATMALEDPNAPQDIESIRVGERELLSLTLMPAGRRDVRGFLWAIETGSRTVVLMRGRCESDGKEGLDRFVNDFAAGMEVVSLDDENKTEADRRRARQYLHDLAQTGLDALWSKYLNRAMVYDAYSYGVRLGRESVLYDESESTDGWLVSRQIQFQSWGLQIRIDESWSVRDGGGTHSRELTRSLRRSEVLRAVVTTDYREIRVPGSDRVDRHLIARTPDGAARRSIRDRVDIDDVYGCEPLLLEVAARMATDAESKPAILTATEPYTAGRVYWILTPLGRVSWPGDPGGNSAYAVRLQFDYDPDPIMLYFDSEGTMLGHASHRGVYYVRTDDESEEEILK